MENTTATPATKQQLDALIQMCLDGGYNEAAGLLQLGSNTISEIVRDFDAKQTDDDEEKSETCTCYEYAGDNPLCPDHGQAQEFSDSDIADHHGIYSLGMGC